MPILSVTRLRLRAPRFLPGFALLAWRSARQVRAAPGFLDGAILADRRLAYWTLTLWESEAQLVAAVTSGSHGRTAPHLARWCDEAAVGRWPADALPSWPEADRRLRAEGRASRLRRPSPRHAVLAHDPPAPRAGIRLVRRTAG